MIDHITFGSNDMKAATAFYDAVMATIGYTRIAEENDKTEGLVAAGYGKAADKGKEPLFWVCLPLDETVPAKACNGTHIAFKAASQTQVDDFYKAALKNGGKDGGAPGLRPHYEKDYYAAFVFDPDGHKIEAVFCNR